MSNKLRIAIAGLGTVGAGTVKLLNEQKELLEKRCGRALEVVAISSRDKNKDRGFDISSLRWVSNPLEFATDPEIDVVVEMIGGSEGVARDLIESALSNGKSVVTANKALVAHHGSRLAKIAEHNNAMLAFEAAVAGGTPIIKTMRDGLSANRFSRVVGILNGTSNYILTNMRESGRDFAEVLKEAQELGYAEADPTFDIGGIDAAHKAAILTSLAYGYAPSMDDIYIEGISHISQRDMIFADELGYVIKLLGISINTSEGVRQRVHPCMIAKDSMLASVRGAYNAILVDGDFVGQIFLEGKGAGAESTASAVVADIIDIARGVSYKPFILPYDKLESGNFVGIDTLRGSYYLRLEVNDKIGVLADITSIFEKHEISLRSFIQHSHEDDEPVQLVLTTHETMESSMIKAISDIEALESVLTKPNMIRIAEF
ncbi:MAG: homoserine dehydrogenase [Rickettsiales bacterium]